MRDVSRGHDGATRVEVWSKGQVVEPDAAVLGCSVTEEWTSGVRMTCALSVEASSDWLRYRALPDLEVKVLSGLWWRGEPQLTSWGVYPVRVSPPTRPRSELKVTGSDRWQWVINSDFPRPTQSWSGEIRRVVGNLVDYAQIYPSHTLVEANRQDTVQPVLWDKSKSETAITLADSIGAEVFYDRDGIPIVRDRHTTAGPALTDDVVLSVTPEEDWSEVVNIVTASGSGDAFEPVTVAITNPAHPAYRWNLGYDKVYKYSSSQLTTAEQARDAAAAMLERKSLPGVGWTMPVIPDPTRAVGQLCDTSGLDIGQASLVVRKISFTMWPKPAMTLTMGAV